MAVPSSGQLRLYADIQVEIGGAQNNTSLRTMSAQAGKSSPDAMSEFYGYSSVVLPTVSTCYLSVNEPSLQRIRGQVNSLGGAPAVAIGFRWGPYSNINQNGSSTQSNSAGTGIYCQDKGASQSSTYYWQAWAQNAAGQATGGVLSATTPAAFTPCGSKSISVDVSGNTYGQSPSWYEIGTRIVGWGQYAHPYLGWTTFGTSGTNSTSYSGYFSGGATNTSPCVQSRGCGRFDWGGDNPRHQNTGFDTNISCVRAKDGLYYATTYGCVIYGQCQNNAYHIQFYSCSQYTPYGTTQPYYGVYRTWATTTGR